MRDSWRILRSDRRVKKTYHYLNVDGPRDRQVVVTTKNLDADPTSGAFVMCLSCVSNTCEHCKFVSIMVTQGAAFEGNRADAPPIDAMPSDQESFSGESE